MPQLNIPKTFQAGVSLPAAWLNANFNAIRAIVNALDTLNLAPNAGIKGTQLADGPVNGITGGKLNDLIVSSDKLAVGAAVRGVPVEGTTVGVATGGIAEVTVCETAPLTTRGGTVDIRGNLSWDYDVVATSGTLTIRVVRVNAALVATVIETVVHAFTTASQAHGPLPTPTTWDTPPAGVYTYRVTVQSSSTDLTTAYTTPNRGRLLARELS